MKKSLLLVTTLLTVHLNLANSAPTAAPCDDSEKEAVVINSFLKVSSKTRTEENQPLNYSLDIVYPQITGTPLPAAANHFNQQIEKIITTEVEQFKKNVKNDFSHTQTLPKEVQHNTLSIDYDVDVIHPGDTSLISVRLNVEGMQAGRAHPFHAYRVLNFDLTHNKVLALSDLFKSQTSYLTTLSNYSTKQLNASLKDKWMIASGAKASVINYKNWNIQADSILITFDEYQVAPYTNGPQEVEIPFSELKPIFSPQARVIAQAKDASTTLG